MNVHSEDAKERVMIWKMFERKIVNFFLSINLNICFGCSKESSHRDGSFEYTQHVLV